MTYEELTTMTLHTLNEQAMEEAQQHWDHIAKPLDGLGRFENMIVQIAGMTGNPQVILDKKAVVPMCADNGIIAEGVSQSGAEVTAIVANNMANGISSVCRMSKVAGADVLPVDIGILNPEQIPLSPQLRGKRVRFGSRNFRYEPAMTRGETLQAIQVGIDMVKECKNQGYKILATGEMGIGNTTTSSAMASMLLQIPVEQVTGKGAGLKQEGIRHKCQIIAEAIQKYHLDSQDTFGILQTFGGYDIAGLVGLYIGGALYQIPVVIDGIIASVAALCAVRLRKEVRDFMLPSHLSGEPASVAIMKELGLTPVIDGQLALGEGTGAVMLFPLLDMVLQVYQENTTFADIAIADYEREE